LPFFGLPFFGLPFFGLFFFVISINYVVMKVKESIKIIEKDGWFLVNQKGSHKQFKHHIKTGHVIMAGNLNDRLTLKALKSILLQAKSNGEDL
jgi:predicted RNA binding protein YcfA (HicA-like mRNA interferase family)